MRDKILILFFICIIFYFCSNESSISKSSEKKELIDSASWAKIEDAVNTGIKEDIIKKLDIQNRKVWVNDIIWQLFNSESKENLAKVVATYCSVKLNQEYRSIEILGWQTGKKLASYSSWSGFKVY